MDFTTLISKIKYNFSLIITLNFRKFCDSICDNKKWQNILTSKGDFG